MKVNSSTIAEIDREVIDEKLYLKVTFKNGREYLYENVPAETYEKFLMAESKGVFFHENINGRYNYSRVK